MIYSEDIELKALSWRQPYADAMLHGKVKTRTWNTNYRGWVLICASQKPYFIDEIYEISGSKYMGQLMGYGPHWHGRAIGIGRLVDCVKMTTEDEDRCMVMYHPSLYCYIYIDVFKIEPFKWEGSLGWRNVSMDIRKQIKIIV